MCLYYPLRLFFVHFGVKTIFTNNCGVGLSIGWACKFILIDIEIELSITYELSSVTMGHKQKRRKKSQSYYKIWGRGWYSKKFECQEIRMARKKCLGKNVVLEGQGT